MSGIAGIYYLDGRPVDDEVDRMVETIEHRGPDGISTWRKNSVGLGHCMLETTPEDQYESLPLVDRSGNFVITADARIDNRNELIRKLDIPEPTDRPITDSELILASYRQWKRDCPAKLMGAFAFAIYDKCERQIFCARDHFGVKPFYYSHRKRNSLSFGSELKAVVAGKESKVSINETRIADELGYIREDVEQTYFQNIFRLPPAHRMTVRPDSVDLQKYWSLDPEREVKFHSEEAYVRRFQELFVEAVSSRMRTRDPLGSMLSGGLDSSSVACAAQYIDKDSCTSPLHTFSAVFDDVPESDERSYIEDVIEEYNFSPHFYRGDQLNPLEPFEFALSDDIDEPLRSANLHINWQAYKQANNHGVRVILDGFDGDTTISHGNGVFRELGEKRKWFTLTKELYSYAKNTDRDFWELASPYIRHFLVKPTLYKIPGYVQLRRSLGSGSIGDGSQEGETTSGRDALLKSAFAEQINWEERRRHLQAEKNQYPKSQRNRHYNALTSGKMQLVLETLDRAASHMGVEVRYPFWDRELIEYCLALPPRFKLGNGWTRRIHRLGTEGILPDRIRWRKDKSDLGYAFDQQFANENEKRLRRLVSGRDSRIEKYADMDTVRSCYEKLRQGQGSGLESYHLWNTLTLDVWLNQLHESSGFQNPN